MSDSLVTLLGQALLLALLLALPFLVAALVAGVVTGLLGALTQVQDAAVGLVVRIAAMAAVGVAFGPFMANKLTRFGHEVMAIVGRVAGGS